MTNTMRDIEAREKACGRKFIGVPGRDDQPRRAKPKTVKKSARPKLVQPVKLDQFGGADASAPIRLATNIMEMRKRFDDIRARQYSDNADFAAKSRRKSTPPSAPSAPKNRDNATKKRNSNVVNDVGTAAAIAGGTPLAASLGKAAISAATHTTRKGAYALTQWGKFLLSGNKGAEEQQ